MADDLDGAADRRGCGAGARRRCTSASPARPATTQPRPAPSSATWAPSTETSTPPAPRAPSSAVLRRPLYAAKARPCSRSGTRSWITVRISTFLSPCARPPQTKPAISTGRIGPRSGKGHARALDRQRGQRGGRHRSRPDAGHARRQAGGAGHHADHPRSAGEGVARVPGAHHVLDVEDLDRQRCGDEQQARHGCAHQNAKQVVAPEEPEAVPRALAGLVCDVATGGLRVRMHARRRRDGQEARGVHEQSQSRAARRRQGGGHGAGRRQSPRSAPSRPSRSP